VDQEIRHKYGVIHFLEIAVFKFSSGFDLHIYANVFLLNKFMETKKYS